MHCVVTKSMHKNAAKLLQQSRQLYVLYVPLSTLTLICLLVCQKWNLVVKTCHIEENDKLSFQLVDDDGLADAHLMRLTRLGKTKPQVDGSSDR